MQVDPIKPKLKPPETKRLKLTCDEPPSNFGFNFKLRPYTMVVTMEQILTMVFLLTLFATMFLQARPYEKDTLDVMAGQRRLNPKASSLNPKPSILNPK
jgi:hypothetical protein